MQTVSDLTQLRAFVAHWRRAGETVVFVPTMGNLHEGHLALLQRARGLGDRSVVSIFVNPIQFGKGEDYERYPSTLAADQEKLSANGLDVLFAPDLAQLYPAGVEEDTRVTVPALSDTLCGEFRPGHFSGVATVVCKLFILVGPDIALFGEKDYQQLLVIRRMAADLCMPIEVVGMPIVREADGLAMSSRNSYLTPDERARAPALYAALRDASEHLIDQGFAAIPSIEAAGMERLKAQGLRPEYFSVRRTHDLGMPRIEDNEMTVLVAAWLGSARLIDNVHIILGAPPR